MLSEEMDRLDALRSARLWSREHKIKRSVRLAVVMAVLSITLALTSIILSTCL